RFAEVPLGVPHQRLVVQLVNTAREGGRVATDVVDVELGFDRCREHRAAAEFSANPHVCFGHLPPLPAVAADLARDVEPAGLEPGGHDRDPLAPQVEEPYAGEDAVEVAHPGPDRDIHEKPGAALEAKDTGDRAAQRLNGLLRDVLWIQRPVVPRNPGQVAIPELIGTEWF